MSVCYSHYMLHKKPSPNSVAYSHKHVFLVHTSASCWNLLDLDWIGCAWCQPVHQVQICMLGLSSLLGWLPKCAIFMVKGKDYIQSHKHISNLCLFHCTNSPLPKPSHTAKPIIKKTGRISLSQRGGGIGQ